MRKINLLLDIWRIIFYLTIIFIGIYFELYPVSYVGLLALILAIFVMIHDRHRKYKEMELITDIKDDIKDYLMNDLIYKSGEAEYMANNAVYTIKPDGTIVAAFDDGVTEYFKYIDGKLTFIK